MIVTGIGSRNTDELGKQRIQTIAKELNKLGWTLRSGGADGADTFFENCFDEDKKEIYLPSKGFNGNKSPLYNLENKHYELASKVHPYYFRLKTYAKKLIARDTCQVLGQELDKPSTMVVCWTIDGANSEKKVTSTTGGTGTAIRVASRNNIPIYNIKNDDDYELCLEYVKTLKLKKLNNSLEF